MSTASKAIDPVRLTQVLFYFNAVLWVALTTETLIGLYQGGGSNQFTVMAIIAALMLGNAAAMVGGGLALGRRQKQYYYFAVILLIINIILTLTDDFGVMDAITVLFDLLIVVLLFSSRNKYEQSPF